MPLMAATRCQPTVRLSWAPGSPIYDPGIPGVHLNTMQRIRVTITAEYLLPDGWEIINHGEERLPALSLGTACFLPGAIEWGELGPATPPRLETELRPAWSEITSRCGLDLMDSIKKQDTTICAIQ